MIISKDLFFSLDMFLTNINDEQNIYLFCGAFRWLRHRDSPCISSILSLNFEMQNCKSQSRISEDREYSCLSSNTTTTTRFKLVAFL